MRQVFLAYSPNLDFENEDAFPVSDQLLLHLEARAESHFAGNQLAYSINASVAKGLLQAFYEQYELSQPQRRILKRLLSYLSQMSSEKEAQFVVADVSSHRDRRQSKKIQSLC